jgi:hypothetical protein
MWRVQIPMYKGIEREIVGVNNFRNILKHNDYKQKTISISEKNISENRFPHEIREIIGDRTVDAYPWEFSYIAANQLKWKPRKTLGISLFSQNDNSEYYLNSTSPDFIIFHLVDDYFGGKLGSLDNRYILNDEPKYINFLLNNYSIINNNNKFLLFKRDTVSHFENVYLDELQKYRFGEWIDVPYIADEIIRFKVFSSNTLLGKLNKFFYKETEYFIDYQLENGIMLTYRYVPGTAVDGLWCNPFIRFPSSDEPESKAVKVRLRNANPNVVRKSFSAQFQHITLKSNGQDSLGIANVLFQ